MKVLWNQTYRALKKFKGFVHIFNLMHPKLSTSCKDKVFSGKL